MSLYYDRQGKPLTTEEFIVLFSRFEYKRIAYTELNDEVNISTVWLGIDHGCGSDKPVIFETMIFGGEHDGYQDRYYTEDEARAGHEKAVALCQPDPTNRIVEV
jgi:hypothetical protein